jgi:hypothetical protein
MENPIYDSINDFLVIANLEALNIALCNLFFIGFKAFLIYRHPEWEFYRYEEYIRDVLDLSHTNFDERAYVPAFQVFYY